ncbi:MAG: phosphoglycerate kinase [Candidatus Paceibacterota bacterium]|jgi:phosphoglycerate kinase
MPSFRTLREIKNLKGKKVLLRLDLNVPVVEGVVKDDFRITRALQTIEYLKKHGARIIIISHFGDVGASLQPVARYLNRFTRVGFVPDIVGAKAKAAAESLPEGGAMLLENLRADAGEKKNSALFAGKLAFLADVFVNEAFSVSHRSHASITRLPKLLPAYAGFLFEEEYKHLSRALKPKKPFVFILGGAKFETKLPLVRHYLPLAKTIFIGGALANALFKMKGYEMGKSSVGKPIPGLKSLLSNKKVVLPEDALLLSGKIVCPDELTRADKIADIGPATLLELKNKIVGAKSILFNGPVGIYDEGFGWGTEEILKLLVKSKAETVIGGGDTLALVTKLKIEKKFTFVSTAGGAMLEFLATGTLPGIEALKNKN